MHFRCRFAIIIKHRATRAVRTGQQMNMGAFPSGHWGQTVNLLLNASVVRIHQLPPKTRYFERGIALFVFLNFAGIALVDSNSCGVASVGPQLSVSETGEARNIRPGGANNRTSGSALLTGGARYAPPNAGPAVTSRGAKMPQWGIFRARLANPPAPTKKYDART